MLETIITIIAAILLIFLVFRFLAGCLVRLLLIALIVGAVIFLFFQFWPR